MASAIIIKGRQYEIESVSASENHPALSADLINRGFDGRVYYLRGARGGYYMAYRTSVFGQYVIVH